ncbi:hypothetical protein M569_02956, partial [Genlisea aurea]
LPASLPQSSILLDSLRVLEWDQLCDIVASFSGTSLGKQAAKEQLWDLNRSYDDSVRLLQETNAAIEMHKYGAMLDFSAIDVSLVDACMRCARRGSPVSGNEAVGLLGMLKFAKSLQLNVKAAVREDSNWSAKFMPLSELILELVISHPLMKSLEQLVDEDGSVKDSASSNLRQARQQVQLFEKRLFQLLESIIRNKTEEATVVLGRNQSLRDYYWEGLRNVIEPLSAVPLNDELQQARASVAKAEEEVLLSITKKIQMDLNDIESVFEIMIRIDMINARAQYSLSFGGAFPDLYLPQDEDGAVTAEASTKNAYNQRKWTIYLPRAYHPLLLQKYRQSLKMAEKDLSNAKAEIRRRKLGGSTNRKKESHLDLPYLEMQISKLKEALPVPFDILVPRSTRVVVITGPNTGGKTICLKTFGLAAMMAKSGLYILASESASVPWFDFVLADIGDEQSLSQSLSTFSGHLKQISEMKSLSTMRSLVLLDEVGAGTNPTEGAAFGMSLLEAFSDADSALLTIATTHHSELKALKYMNPAFENACMEFDELNLKPTYRILWGIPGRSNAINIAERLGLPGEILVRAREVYGTAGAGINEAIDMERFKQSHHQNVEEAQRYQGLVKEVGESIASSEKRIAEHAMKERYRVAQEMWKSAASARSVIHKEFRSVVRNSSRSAPAPPPSRTEEEEIWAATSKNGNAAPTWLSDEKGGVVKVGDMVEVRGVKNGKAAKVVELDVSKQEVVVEAGFLKMKLRLGDVV